MLRGTRLAAGAAVVAAMLSMTAFGTTAGAAGAGPSPTAPGPASGVIVVAAADVSGAPTPDDLAAARVAGMGTRERAASVVMGHIPTTDPAEAAAYLSGGGLGGFILMGANVPADEAALRSLTAAMSPDSSFPPLLAIDQEGGDVSRLRWDAFPSSVTLKDADTAATRDAFAARAALVARAGLDVNFGIVADTTADPSMFIFRRALGASPDAAGTHVAAAVEGEGREVVSTLKHFPGHGAAAGDSHAGIPATTESLEEWRVSDAVPFGAGIDAGAQMLMFGHLRYTAVDAAPASLSPEWHRIAREELGFDGVAVTDDLGMLEASGEPAYADAAQNAVAAIAAGNDLVLSVMFTDASSASRIVDAIVAAVDSGVLPAERLTEAATRVAALRIERAAVGDGFAPCAECAPAS